MTMYQILKYEQDYDWDTIWNEHPKEYSTVVIYDKKFKCPRWIQAYGKDYAYSGQVAKSLPVTSWLEPFLVKAKTISPTVNGILANWYDGALKHKIGAHRDNEKGLTANTDIITISLGEERVFRFRKYKSNENPIDIILQDKDILVIPYETNLAYTHEVPHLSKYQGKRISLTFRTFK